MELSKLVDGRHYWIKVEQDHPWTIGCWDASMCMFIVAHKRAGEIAPGDHGWLLNSADAVAIGPNLVSPNDGEGGCIFHGFECGHCHTVYFSTDENAVHTCCYECSPGGFRCQPVGAFQMVRA